MRVAIRVDASTQIGTGHFMRCLTLADALKERGAEVCFISRYLPDHLCAMLEDRLHGFILLETSQEETDPGELAHAAWLGVSQARDAADTLNVLSIQTWDWLVVDHYALDICWESTLANVAAKIMVIDDLANRRHACDLLLDQNLQEPGRYANLVPEGCQVLLGPKFALLRPQFVATRQNLRQRTGRVARLLVFFGGADAGGETLKALAAIRMLGRDDLDVDVVIGESNPHRAAIESVCLSMQKTTLYCQVDDMATRMAQADLFIGAGGISSWERCCLGLPALVVATADNQIAQCEALGSYGVQLYMGKAQLLTFEQLRRSIGILQNDCSQLKNMAAIGLNLVDGLGVERMLEHLQ